MPPLLRDYGNVHVIENVLIPKKNILRMVKKVGSTFGVYKFLVFSKVLPHSFNLLIYGYVNGDFKSYYINW